MITAQAFRRLMKKLPAGFLASANVGVINSRCMTQIVWEGERCAIDEAAAFSHDLSPSFQLLKGKFALID